jgi:hypothetical protein
MAIQKSDVRDITCPEESPEISKSINSESEAYPKDMGLHLPSATADRITRTSSILSVLVAGIALFSDGYNAQIIGYMEPLFSDL